MDGWMDGWVCMKERGGGRIDGLVDVGNEMQGRRHTQGTRYYF